MKIIYLILSVCFCYSTLAAAHSRAAPSETISTLSSQHRIISLPTYGRVKDVEITGYLPVSGEKCASPSCQTALANLFFWFAESESDPLKDPLIIWLNGGPGSSSLYGLFIENGPYEINKAGRISKRFYSWTKQANYMVIDQPAGVGYSYAADKHYPLDEAQAMNQLYHAIQFFFRQNPKLSQRPLYIAGESYAGKYIPELAVRILAGNEQPSRHIHLNLQGIIIGDGWVNPLIQQSVNADYAYSHGLIDQNTYQQVSHLYQSCAQALQHTTNRSSSTANQTCEKMQELIKQSSGLNLVNVAASSEPDDKWMTRYLNKPEVRNALHVDARIKKYALYSKNVETNLEADEQNSAAALYPILLKNGVRVLLYNGLEDAKDSNFMGTDKWLAALDWPGRQAFSLAPTCIWRINQQVAGYARSASGLTQIKIRGAGHIAIADKPKELFDLIHRFMGNLSFCESQESLSLPQGQS